VTWAFRYDPNQIAQQQAAANAAANATPATGTTPATTTGTTATGTGTGTTPATPNPTTPSSQTPNTINAPNAPLPTYPTNTSVPPSSAPTPAPNAATSANFAAECEERVIQALHIVLILSNENPAFLQSGRMLQYLFEVWDSAGHMNRLRREESLPLSYIEETQIMVKCFLNYARYNKEDVSILWKLLSVFKLRSLIDFSFLAHFYAVEVAQQYSAQQKRHVLKQFLQYFENSNTSEYSKTRALRLLIIPMMKD
jgi:hypothetical protein